MKRSHFRLLSVAALGSVISGAAVVGFNAVARADDKDSAPTIKQIMKIAHTGDKKEKVDPLCKVIISGKGTHETADQLLKLYKALAAATPPRGDEADWKKRTGDLVSAAEALDKGDMPSADSISAYKKALDCKGCHTEHKPAKQ
jgi:hypothetical protein